MGGRDRGGRERRDLLVCLACGDGCVLLFSLSTELPAARHGLVEVLYEVRLRDLSLFLCKESQDIESASALVSSTTTIHWYSKNDDAPTWCTIRGVYQTDDDATVNNVRAFHLGWPVPFLLQYVASFSYLHEGPIPPVSIGLRKLHTDAGLVLYFLDCRGYLVDRRFYEMYGM